jgi:GntR family transcriptional regulator, transcriptional repressor for pyruvate dehydrogenase complex
MASVNQKLNDQLRGAFQREPVSEQITQRILSLIREQQLRPGDRLPPERELAALMNVSRPTVREALRSLAMMNVVDLRHGSGTYITSLEPQLLVERFDLVFSLNDNSFLDLIEARKAIEPGATALAAARADEESFQVLQDIIERSWVCLRENPADFPKLDVEFHVKVAECSGNALLSRIMQAVAQLSIASSQRTAASSQGKVSTRRVERAIRGHQSILDALRRRDDMGASKYMAEHLQEVENTLRGLYEDEE